MSMTGNFNGPGPYVVDIAPVSGAGILPSGNDDSARLTQYVSDMAASGLPAVLGAGDFIIGTPMSWRSAKVMSKWSGKGIGLTVRGQGPGDTRLLWSAALSDANNMLTINAPTAAGIGARNYLTQLSNMSLVRAPGGTEIAAGSTDGYGLYGGPAQAGDVLHTPKFSSMFFDGFAYPVTLSDCTLPTFDHCWWNEFLVGLRLGYNLDIVKIKHSMFGSEQFGASYRNGAIAIQDLFNDGIHGSTSNLDQLHIEATWFMKLGLCLSINGGGSVIIGRGTYLEDCRQHWNSESGSAETLLTVDGVTLSVSASNDDSSYPKFSFGNHALVVNMRGVQSGGYSPLGGWLAFQNPNTRANWDGCNVYASGSGNSTHMRWQKAGELHVRAPLPNKAQGIYSFGGTTGMSKFVGPEVPLTVASTGTVNPAHTDGDLITVPAMTGNVTINPASSNPSQPATGVVMTYVIQASATTPASFAVTWGANFIFNTAFTQPGAGDANKRTVVQFRCQNGLWRQIGAGNTWA